MLIAATMNVPAALAYVFDIGETRTLALIVRGRDARALGLKTIDDVARQSSGWRAAFTSDLMNADPSPGPRRRGPAAPADPARPTGYSGLASLYDLRFPQPPRTLNPPASYYALADGVVDVIAGDMYAQALWKHDLVVVADNRGYFSPYGTSMSIAVRSIIGQLAATIGAAAWIFTTLIALQGILSLLPRRLRSLCTVSFQVVFVASLLSLFVMMPAALRASVSALERASSGPTGALWLLPPVWFLGIHETALGSTRPLFHALARLAFLALGISTFAATAVVVSSYRQRLRASVAGASASSAWKLVDAAKRAAARIVAPSPDSRAVLGFTLITLARSRPHQLLLATYTGVGVALSSAILVHAASAGGVQSLLRLRVAVLWVPLVLFLTMLLGIRAAFRLPSELSAAWTFHFHAREPARTYAAATRRAAVIVCIVPVLAVAFAVYGGLFGARIAAIHVAFCAMMGLGLLEWLFRRFDQIPFTRAYDAGQAKARRWWWPLSILVLDAYAHWPVAAELRLLQSPDRAITVLLVMLGGLLLLQWSVRHTLSADVPLVFESTPESPIQVLELS